MGFEPTDLTFNQAYSFPSCCNRPTLPYFHNVEAVGFEPTDLGVTQIDGFQDRCLKPAQPHLHKHCLEYFLCSHSPIMNIPLFIGCSGHFTSNRYDCKIKSNSAISFRLKIVYCIHEYYYIMFFVFVHTFFQLF